MTDYLSSREPGLRARNAGRRLGVDAFLDAYELDVEESRREFQRYNTLAFFGVATWCPRTIVGRGLCHLGVTDETLRVGGFDTSAPYNFQWWREYPWHSVAVSASGVRGWWYVAAGTDRYCVRQRDAEVLAWWLRAKWETPSGS